MTRELENNTIININIPLKREQKITKCKQLWFLQENIITVSFFFIKMRKSMKLNRLSTGMWDCKDKSAGICQNIQR